MGQSENEYDPILTRPDIYGLSHDDSLSSLSSSSLSQRDSGYLSYEENMQLAKDLAYIDTTYYPTRKSSTHKHMKGTKSSNKGLEISITDVLLSSPDKTLNEVYLSGRSICSLSPGIGIFSMIRKLDLSNNCLTDLPESVGYMQNLEYLSLAKNRLKAIPGTISYLVNLLELDVSFNELTELTPHIGHLRKLKTLLISYNRIAILPTEIRGLNDLIMLDVSRNPLRVLPAEVAKLPYLRRIRLEECPLDINLSYSIKKDPPSLVELCARKAVRSKINVDELPNHLITYVKSAKSCTCCLGPYFESNILRGRLMEKPDHYIPLEYTLCSAHWIDSDDRIRSMFSTQPETCHDTVLLPERPMLPDQPIYSSMEKMHKRRPYASSYETSVVTNSSQLIPTFKSSGDKSLSKFTIKFKRPNIPW